jgi:hypothetical protein
MRHVFLRPVLINLVFVALIAFGSGAAAPALAAPCRDGVGPCGCGDTVVTPTKLDRSDPGLREVCTRNRRADSSPPGPVQLTLRLE